MSFAQGVAMGEKGSAFVKGGVGCLAVFIVLAAVALFAGGTAHIDLGGGICLFVGGGLLGLLVLWIYNKGRKAGPPPGGPDHS